MRIHFPFQCDKTLAGTATPRVINFLIRSSDHLFFDRHQCHDQRLVVPCDGLATNTITS
jgi:hypothetical protein